MQFVSLIVPTPSVLQDCRVDSSTSMECQTPQVDIPHTFLGAVQSRTKRSDDNHQSQARYEVDGESLAFYVGFVLDDIDTYKFYNETSSGWSEYKVSLKPPQISGDHQFMFDPEIKSYILIKVCQCLPCMNWYFGI